MTLAVDSFPFVFESVHGHAPFAWQIRLLHEVVESGWPSFLAAPTGAGKTAVLDVALFHLALERSIGKSARRAPVRVVFAVDRRIIVDQAFERARKIKSQLAQADEGLLKQVGGALGGPIHIAQLRGGIPREDDWARMPDQPTILCTTVDQLGSRLLFRGYGVSESMASVHAGLLGEDALILLDEAHLSTAFHETLGHIARHRSRATEAKSALPWMVCALTATPRNNGGNGFRLNTEERGEEKIARRLRAKKLVQLIEIEERHGSMSHVDAFVRTAEDLAKPNASIAIVVNRVAFARDIREKLAARGHEAILLTGRARPIARDVLIKTYGPRLESGRNTESKAPLFVVATQCIEAGADFDFDTMITQIAPLDSLRQRFGRLDRLGERSPTFGAIIAAKDEIATKADDPIYGNRAKRTWDWLCGNATSLANKHNSPLDFGPDGLEALIALDCEGAKACTAAAKSAPILRAADVAFLAMTNPHPYPEPHLPLFLHGDARAEVDISIVWRADLPARLDAQSARYIIACMPPKPAEALAVPLWAVKKWLSDQKPDDVADVEAAVARESDALSEKRKALRWRGPDDEKTDLVGAAELRPGDLIVVPALYGGCDEYGWAPNNDKSVEDLGDLAAAPYEGRRSALRLHSSLWPFEQETPWSRLHAILVERKDSGARSVIKALAEIAPSEIASRLDRFRDAKVELVFPYNDDGIDAEAPSGVILLAPHGLPRAPSSEGVEAITEGDDAGSFCRAPLGLFDHVAHVEAKVREFAAHLGLRSRLVESLGVAARHHDAGKADPRFQTYLAGGQEPGEHLLAKSGRSIVPALARISRAASGLPKKWRHEALSVRLAAQKLNPANPNVDAALVLFLIGSHHGQGRPFFAHHDPWDDHSRTISTEALAPGAGPERLDFDWHGRDWAELFDGLNARYGAWGLAYLETVLRLADHRASEEADLRSRASR